MLLRLPMVLQLHMLRTESHTVQLCFSCFAGQILHWRAIQGPASSPSAVSRALPRPPWGTRVPPS